MSLAGRKRRQSLKLICEINMTAFLSIQLALLSMFMVVVPDANMSRISVDLAKVDHPVSMRVADREDAIVIAVMRDGAVFFVRDKTLPDQLELKIREQVALGAENKVYINADARARYELVREVLGAVHSAGVENVGFLVAQREKMLRGNVPQ